MKEYYALELPSCGFNGNDEATIRRVCGYEKLKQEDHKTRRNKSSVPHIVAVLLLIVGMSAGYSLRIGPDKMELHLPENIKLIH